MFSRANKIASFNAVSFLALGLHLPYWPVWLSSRGLSAAEIGYVMALASAMRVLLTPQVAAWADEQGERRRPLIILSIVTFLGFAAYMPLEGFWPILLLTIVTSFLFGAMIPITDATALKIAREDHSDYGRIRLWGSVTFMIANMGCGWLLSRGGLGVGSDLILYGIVLFFALTIIFAWMLPKIPFDVDREKKTGRWKGTLELVRDWRLVAFMVLAAAMQAGHAVYYAFGTLNWQRLNVSEDLIGLLWATGVIAEIILFAFAEKVVRRIGPYRMLMIAGASGAIRWTAMVFDPSLPWLILLQCLHAGTFGMTHLAALHFIHQNVPENRAATAQSLLASVFIGSFMGAMTFVSGSLYELWYSGAYAIMGGIGLAVLVGASVLRSVKPATQPGNPPDGASH